MLNLSLNMEISRVTPVNHRQEARATPEIKGMDWEPGRVTWKAPSIMVPSMMAWGLNQVTTQAEEMVLRMDMAPPDRSSSSALARSRPMPMKMTMMLPTSKMASWSH